MAQLRLRIQLNKGRLGAPLSKLGRIAEQAERFLRLLAAEAEIDQSSGEWLAVNFANGSVSYDAEFQGSVTPAQAAIFNRHLEFVVDYDPDSEGPQGMVRAETLVEFARIGTLIDPDEVIGIGLYREERKRPIWRQINYAKAVTLRQELEAPLPTYGAVQGIIHSLQKEARQPYFQIRELSTDQLVRCSYNSAQYHDVAEALQERTSIVHVSGDITYDRVSRTISEMRMDRLERARVLTPAEFEQFFGSAPTFTGELSTDDYMDSIRGDA
ncbi:MAG: hypothetical protein ACLP19_23415 [Xanthobacteraceae bacterium]